MTSPLSSSPIPTLSGAVCRAERHEAACGVAREIAELVRERARAGRETVLGLATGATMVELYEELVKLRHKGAWDPATVQTFNLDEYVGLGAGDAGSFHEEMRRALFEPAGLDPARTHLPDGRRAATDPAQAARDYEAAIRAAGGIDLQLLGLGRNAHVAFNEPGCEAASRTHVVELAQSTRLDAVTRFGSLEAVPRHALTVGLGTILEAGALRLLAFGTSKAAAAHAMLLGEIGPSVPASQLRGHPDLRVWLDEAAAAHLPR